LITVIVVGWVCPNLVAAAFGVRPVDPPPFLLLGGAVSLVSLFIVLVILATPAARESAAQRRELLILELTLLGEQKTAKVIQLLEESRRDIRSFATGPIRKLRPWRSLPTPISWSIGLRGPTWLLSAMQCKA
jgi:uncharacterized membrane protein